MTDVDWGRRASVTAVDEATDCENPRGGKRKGRKTAKVAILLLPSFNALDLAVVLQSLEEADRIAAMTAPGKHLGRPVFLSIAGGEIGGANSAFRISTQRLDGKTSYRYLIAVGADDAPSAEVAQLGNQLALARRILPHLTAEDIRNPHDFPGLTDPDWHFEDGQLTGVQAILFLVRKLRRDLDSE